MRLGVGIALALLVVACSRPVPSVTPHPVMSVPPPAVYVNDLAGQAWSWCWVTECADGMMSADAPLVSEPLILRFELQPASIGASVRRIGTDGAITLKSVEVLNGKIQGLPAGQWDYLTVGVAYAPRGDAAYAWRLR